MTNSNPKYTEAEIEDARHEMWVLSDGPAKAQRKHRQMSVISMADDLEINGWVTVQDRMVRRSCSEFDTTELIIRKGNTVKLVQWHTFNKGWMEKLDCGWGIFHP